MGKLFGTDGVRGVAGKDLTCELSLQIGRGMAAVLTKLDGHRPKILIGKDTRVSGDMLESTLAAGLCSVGADVVLLGVIPTPGVAYLVRKYQADAGIMISASHNPMEFNGIKIFGPEGYKLTDDEEDEIERMLLDRDIPLIPAEPEEIGRCTEDTLAAVGYAEYLASTVPEGLAGMKVLVDCSNGSAVRTAGMLFGLLCSSVYLFIGGWNMALSWFISGIPFDIMHGIGNAIMVAVLFIPLDKLFARLKTEKFE